MEHLIESYIKNFPKYGEQKAVTDDCGFFTYNQLFKFACNVAGNLNLSGVKYGDRIILKVRRSKEYVGCLVAIWFVGGVAIPLTDDYPKDRLEFIKKDSNCKLIIDDNYLSKIDKKTTAKPIIPNINDDSIIVYTSGSSGNPKGVIHTYHSMTETTIRNETFEKKDKSEKNEIVGLIPPFTFIAGIGTTMSTLKFGQNLVIAPDEIRKDPFKLAKFYDDYDIQSSYIPPRMAEFMVKHNKSLKIFSVGSERITNLFFNNHPVLLNFYGSTETFAGVMYFNIDKPYDNTPIGKTFAKEKAYILDENLNEVEQGELCLTGVFARGYLNLKEESERAFIPNPFKDRDGFETMFRTKDLARKLPDGNIVFVERKDWMIKINGQRVEPLEIESTIRKLKGIKKVAVKDFTTPNGVTFLVAYFISDEKINEEIVKNHCKKNLTSYMVPTYYIKMNEFPTNSNGKLDRKNLPQPKLEEYKREYVAPTSKIEKRVCQVIEDVLGCGKVGRNDDFFLLGGDSVKSLELVNALDDLPIDVAMIFKGKTPEGICKLIENGNGSVIPFKREKRKFYHLTDSQLGVYFPSISNPNNTMYNNPLKISFDKKIDVKKLIKCVEEALNNHLSFKCKIDSIEGVPSMIPLEKSIRVNLVKTENINKELRNFVKPFDLKNDNLVRCDLFESKKEYVLAFDFHHIVFDGTSLSILLKEISKLFDGQEIYEEKTSICDLSLYEDALKQSSKYKEAEKYFTNKFDGLDISNDALTDFEDQNKMSLGIGYDQIEIPENNLFKFLKSNAITENSLFLAAYCFAVAKFNGSNKSIVCVAENGRNNSLTFNTTGMLVRTIALPVDLSKEKDVTDFIRHVQKDFKESCEHDFYPFTELANKYNLNNDFMFVYQGTMVNSLKLKDKDYLVEGIENRNSISKMSLSVFKDKNIFKFIFNYRSDLFYKDVIESFIKTYVQIVKEFLVRDSIRNINLLSKTSEKNLDKFNETEFKYDDKNNLISLFYQNVKKFKNKNLAIFKDKKFTYKNVNEITNKIANYIIQQKLKHDVIGILIPRNEYTFLTPYAVLKSGCCYEPLDSSYPSERLNYMLKDSNAKLLITTKELRNLVSDYKGKILYLEDVDKLNNYSDVDVKISHSDKAVILYTSGSTGSPKGVVLNHGNLYFYVMQHMKTLNLDQNSIGTLYASFGFDAFTSDLIAFFSCGGTLHLIPEELRLDLFALNSYIKENKLTHVFMTTQVAHQFAMVCDSPYMKYLSFGGEKIVPFDTKKLGYKCFNLYGPTETTMYVTSFLMKENYLRVPIGKANKNIKLYVVDSNLKRMPIGFPGELLISGLQVGDGYLNLPKKTESVFIKNPFTNNPSYKKAYRTGDIARFLGDGNIDLVGRNDCQVKIRGFRIELTEVEEVIREFKGINDATVIALDNPNGGKYLAAYFVSNSKIDIDELSKFIGLKKPSYMIPEAMLQIEAIPLNQNQKVNKKALPYISKVLKKPLGNNVLSENKIIKGIRKILKKVLNEDNFGYGDNLFDFGMNSLSIVRLSVLIKEEFKVNIDISNLLKECSIDSIEDLIISNLLDNKILKEEFEKEIKDKYPLLQSQVGIYTEYLKDIKSIKYNIPVILTFEKKVFRDLSLDGLKEKVEKVFDVHPAIKCTFGSDENGKFVMFPHNGKPIEIETKKCNEKEFVTLSKNFVKPHDLSKKVYRVICVEENENLHILLDIHHIMFDGSSQRIFLRDLNKVLNGEKLQKESFSIFDAALKETQTRSSEVYNEAKKYYENLLSVVDTSTIIEPDTYKKEIIPKSLDIVEEEINIGYLKDFVEKNNLTLNSFFLTAYSILLAKMTYQQIVCFPTIYNGRNSLDLTNLIGMTVKTLPFVCNLENNPSIKELLISCKKEIMNNMANDIYSFSEISKEFNLSFESVFIYQGEISQNDNFKTSFLTLSDLKCDLEIEVRNDDNKIYYHVEFNNGKYSKELIKRLLKYLSKVVKELLEKKNVDDINLVDEIDQNELDKFNSYKLPYNEHPIIFEIQKNLKKYPDKTALIFRDKKFTYRQVDILSNKIANYLKSVGVGKGDVVGILIKRSDLIVTIPLAVMKVGACFQPFDSSYPNERINFMLKDSKAKVLITEKELRTHADLFKGNTLFIEDFNKLKDDKDCINNLTEPEDLFCLLYTSGTTGNPKGVMIQNKNLSSIVSYDIYRRKIEHESISLAYASFGFDAYLIDTFSSLYKGATICICQEEIRLELHTIDELVKKNKITHIIMTTQIARQFALITTSPFLRSLGFGGERILPFERKNATFTIQNCYGPTECSVYCNSHLMKGNYDKVPIGKPNLNLKEYVLDKNNKILPVYAVGELGVSGPQVAKGYLNLNEKTQHVFIPNKFTNEKGCETIYKTGDVVRLLPNGEYDFIGRNDSQVKIRGFRIELSEIEKIIKQFEKVKDVVVNAYDDPAGGKYIAAYVVSDSPVDVVKLNNFILKEKPSYMVPKVTMQLDEIPLTVNGKVDKKKLPKPDLSTNKNYVAPTNKIEEEFCELFGKILGITKVGIEDNFFSLGGSSIDAAQVISFAFNKGYDLVYKNIFDYPTPKKLSDFIAKSKNIVQDEIEKPETFNGNLEPIFINNVSEQLVNLKTNDIGNILLFGATGFLGTHILRELVINSKRKIICVVRKNELQEPKLRLQTLLTYYFEEPFTELFGKRIFVIDSDLLDDQILSKVKKFDFDTIINCAAVVKHFSSDNSIEKTNTGGAKNLINLAINLNKKLIHISTLSVSGESINGNISPEFKFKETMLNVGQIVDNKYIKSKFDAETEIKNAIKNRGLRAKIIRVGNLMSRNSDGEFQINFNTNNFMNTIKAFSILKCVPYDMLSHSVEFSPIDSVSKAILLLASTNDMFNVFHVNNIHSIQMNNVIDELNHHGIIIKKVTNEEFGNTLSKLLSEKTDVKTLNSLLAYRANRNERRVLVPTENMFTLNTLYRLGFYWPLPDKDYLAKLIEYLISLDFFNK